MVKQTHHQRGAGPSTTPEIRSVIQLKLRLFNTNGVRSSGRSTPAEASLRITSDAVGVSFIVSSRSTSSFFFRRRGDADVTSVRHFRIRIPNPAEITRPRFYVQIIKQPII